MRKLNPGYSIVLPAAAFFLYVAGSASFLGQWDSYDYLKQIVTHQLSALGFGRPVYLGYNIVLWESAKRIFGLQPLQVEAVVMAGTILLGVAGVVLFRRLAGKFLPPEGSRMAALALAVAPMYAVYSGFIMTEVPMLVALLASALLLLRRREGRGDLWDIAAGVFFGAAVGIREQAICLGAAYLWLIWIARRSWSSRVRTAMLFGTIALAVIVAPIGSLYLADPAAFMERMRVWLRAIPMGRVQFWNNVQASLLYLFVVCPAAWLALAAAGTVAAIRRCRGEQAGNKPRIPSPGWGFLCCILLPVAALWRDADVQIHPRYLLIALPPSLIMCAAVYSRWIRSPRGPIFWAVAQVLVFGVAIMATHPFRQVQAEKMEFARQIKDAVPGEALMISGSYSPILDYYRGIGVRPRWQILWSGWEFNPHSSSSLILHSWDTHIPVYLSNDPLGWRFFEREYLHYYRVFKDCRKELILPKLIRIHPHSHQRPINGHPRKTELDTHAFLCGTAGELSVQTFAPTGSNASVFIAMLPAKFELFQPIGASDASEER